MGIIYKDRFAHSFFIITKGYIRFNTIVRMQITSINLSKFIIYETELQLYLQGITSLHRLKKRRLSGKRNKQTKTNECFFWYLRLISQKCTDIALFFKIY